MLNYKVTTEEKERKTFPLSMNTLIFYKVTIEEKERKTFPLSMNTLIFFLLLQRKLEMSQAEICSQLEIQGSQVAEIIRNSTSGIQSAKEEAGTNADPQFKNDNAPHEVNVEKRE